MPQLQRGFAMKSSITLRKLFRQAALAGLFFHLVNSAALADGDAVKGEQIFKKCAACHAVTDKTNKVGPYLFGVFNRKVASVEVYNYSDGMKEFAATGAMWDEATLSAYLENPKAIVPRTKMGFGGIKDGEQRTDLIAFLKSKM
jgi:cytochrome c